MFNIFKNKFIPRFVKAGNIKKIAVSDDYQIVQILDDYQWKQQHILFSVHLTYDNFKTDYKNVLDKNKKIVLFGNYHRMAEYYRFLEYNGYKPYLVKH